MFISYYYPVIISIFDLVVAIFTFTAFHQGNRSATALHHRNLTMKFHILIISLYFVIFICNFSGFTVYDILIVFHIRRNITFHKCCKRYTTQKIFAKLSTVHLKTKNNPKPPSNAIIKDSPNVNRANISPKKRARNENTSTTIKRGVALPYRHRQRYQT